MIHSLDDIWDTLDELLFGPPKAATSRTAAQDAHWRKTLFLDKLAAQLEENSKTGDDDDSSTDDLAEFSRKGARNLEDYDLADAEYKFRLTQLMEAASPQVALEEIREEVSKLSLLHKASDCFVHLKEKARRRSPEDKPIPLLLFTDPGQDLDDELSLIMLAALQRRQSLRVIGVVANLAPSLDRARLTKGTLVQLGLGSVPVAAGSDGGCPDHKASFLSSPPSYLAPEEAVEKDAEAMLLRVLGAEEDNSVVVLCISSLKDACNLLCSHEELFVQKVALVTIQGGLVVPETPIEEREGVPLLPDKAANNEFDSEAARRFYTRLQELNIRLNVLTRFAAYVVPMPKKLYDGMELTGNPIARRLVTAQRTSMEGLWQRCNATGEARMGLPERCTTEWFKQTFLDGKGDDRSGTDSIWDLVEHFNMYDVLALVFSVPSLSWRFFQPTVLSGTSMKPAVCLVGMGSARPGIKEATKLRDFVISGLIESLVLDC